MPDNKSTTMDALSLVLRWTGWGVIVLVVVPMIASGFRHGDLGDFVGGFFVFGGPLILSFCYLLAAPLLRWGKNARRGLLPRRWAALYLAAEAGFFAYAFTFWRGWWIDVWYDGRERIVSYGSGWGASEAQIFFERAALLGFSIACAAAALIVLWPKLPRRARARAPAV